jgi:hypothetical protein
MSASVSLTATAPAVGHQVDQAFLRQQLDRLSQRRAGHTQLLCQHAFVQLGAGRNAAFDEPVRRRAATWSVSPRRAISITSAMDADP